MRGEEGREERGEERLRVNYLPSIKTYLSRYLQGTAEAENRARGKVKEKVHEVGNETSK